MFRLSYLLRRNCRTFYKQDVSWKRTLFISSSVTTHGSAPVSVCFAPVAIVPSCSRGFCTSSEETKSQRLLDPLLSILRDVNIRDVAVISIPRSQAYADFMVIGSAISSRHLKAACQEVRKSLKRHEAFPKVPTFEGDTSTDWSALDLGSIVLHLMTRSTRETYDLETLWTCGAECDDLSRDKMDYEQLLAAYQMSNPGVIGVLENDGTIRGATTEGETVSEEQTLSQ
ncbi:unnamed protein product [Cyprideis torosa]|uniref:Mitochondrial assembly of ribosomal large subunit protein 1 n=1 Tax=Cyprideis torosa TaxID=163714 RepID=A0A7R8ZKI0_9CRUS|nr:unnamed protein product [Cyprideis torosa]CAG0884496.1 unnamed protein product [Cyprideis torosa]